MDIQSQPNFVMLTKRLYNLFRNYIIDGRIRAPPESNLSDMIPTFQEGAKTNRRALQSKFKSWAKRMAVVNDNLVLAATGRMIIPQEKCNELIMSLHSEEHVPIDRIIFQIQQKYTWTKKNFGMDREIVIKAISKHCKEAECRREMKDQSRKNHITEVFKKTSLASRRVTFLKNKVITNPLIFPTKNYSRPLALHPSYNSPKGYSIPQRFFSNGLNSVNDDPRTVNGANFMMPMPLPLNWPRNEEIGTFRASLGSSEIIQGKNIVKHDRNCYARESHRAVVNYDVKNEKSQSISKPTFRRKYLLPPSSGPSKEREMKLVSNRQAIPAQTTSRKLYFSSEGDSCSSNSRLLVRSCKKIRNMHELKALLEFAEQDPKAYPQILKNPQTRFLSALGLAPRRICSKKTLSKFRRELRRRQVTETRQIWFRERKVLRDRNKINKRISHSQNAQQYPYLVTPVPHKSLRTEVVSIAERRKCNNVGPETKRSSRRDRRGRRNKKKNPHATVLKIPEIINIYSSGEEDQPCTISRRESRTFDHMEKGFKGVRKFDAGMPTNSGKKLITQEYPQVYGAPILPKFDTAEEITSENVPLNSCLNADSSLKNSNVNRNSSQPKQHEHPHNEQEMHYIDRNPQLQYPFMRPFLIPSSSTGNVAFLPPSNFPFIVRPMNAPLPPLVGNYCRGMKPAGQGVNASPPVEKSVLRPGGVMNSLIQNGSVAPSPSNQIPEVARHFKVIVLSNTPGGGILLVPAYPQIVPRNKDDNSSNNLENKPIASKTTKVSENIPPSGTAASKIGDITVNTEQQGTSNGSSTTLTDQGIGKTSCKMDIDDEMKRLADWIEKMKAGVTPTAFRQGIEMTVWRLTSELNVGIDMVKDVRNALLELEKKQDVRNALLELEKKQEYNENMCEVGN